MNAVAETINVEVVYALPERQELIHLRLHEGATVQQAIESSGLLQKYPDLTLARQTRSAFSPS